MSLSTTHCKTVNIMNKLNILFVKIPNTHLGPEICLSFITIKAENFIGLWKWSFVSLSYNVKVKHLNKTAHKKYIYTDKKIKCPEGKFLFECNLYYMPIKL